MRREDFDRIHKARAEIWMFGIQHPDRVIRVSQAPKEPPRKSLFRKAMMFLRAVSGPKVGDEIFAERLAACRACRFRKEESGHEYCGQCECPTWKYAQLDNKLRYALVDCPIGIWQAVESE